MYTINFNKLTIEKIKGGISSYNADYSDIDFNTDLKMAAAKLNERIGDLACYQGKKSPLSLNFDVGQCENEDDFEDRVNNILSTFVLWNCGENQKVEGREHYYDCPREFIPYINISRSLSKKMTNLSLKIPNFTINIKGGDYCYSLINENELEMKGLKKVNAR